ncbi:MAG: gluconeogenesis factor YvcK family protein [Minisyncoccia bacterium]
MDKQHTKKVKFVCFGGGNAMPKVVLEPLLEYSSNITSITSMVDNGGSTGQLREDFGILPPGDIRRHILALSKAPQWKKDLLSFRFGREVFDGGHKGHNFANVFMAGMENVTKDYGKVLDIIHEFMEVEGRALPATVQNTQLFAILENGEIIKGEDEIDVPKIHNPSIKIRNIYVEPEVDAYDKSLDAVSGADVLIIGPGDLYSSSLPCFLMKGMKEEVAKSKAKKIFVCNIMTKLGETNDFSVSDFTHEVEKYLGCELDHVIYNSKIPSERRIMEYKKKEPTTLNLVKINEDLDEKKYVGKDILADEGPLHHDAEKLIKVIMDLSLI